MRHKKGLRKLNRTGSHRRAMFRNQVTSLFREGGIETTVTKAKTIRPIAEKLVTLAREDTLARRRQAYGYVLDKEVVHTLFAEIGPRYQQRPGGYTRIIRTRVRPGDAAELARIELV